MSSVAGRRAFVAAHSDVRPWTGDAGFLSTLRRDIACAGVRRSGHGLVILALVLLCAVPLSAQNTDLEALSGLKFNFGNPGARSLAMGGAFIGLADDASAAEANPAGLTILRRPEISVDLRDTVTSQKFAVGGTYPFINERDFPARNKGVGFASAVLPFHRAAFALYYHRALQFSNRVDVLSHYSTPVFYFGPQGLLTAQECVRTPGCLQHQVYPYAANADVELNTFGFAAAWSWQTLSAGLAVRYERFSENATTSRSDLDVAGLPTFVVTQRHGDSLFGRSSNHDLTYIAGLKWSPTAACSLGAVYKKGARFPAPVFTGSSASNAGSSIVGVTDFHVPDSLGAGLSWRPAPALTVNVDLVRVGYSSLTDHFVSVIEYGTEDAGGVEGLAGYESHDGTEVHAGVEYFILGAIPVAVRGGWWRDPAHSIHFGAALDAPHAVAAAILFPDRKAENHYSVGVGIALTSFQIDLGYDTSETLKQASVSMVARF